MARTRLLLVAALAVAMGCGSSKPPEAVAPVTEQKKAEVEDPPAKPTPENVPNTKTASGVKIADEILKACGISEPEAYFAFDSDKLDPKQTAPLDKVAVCFISGPMKGRSLKIVGHADPRGDSEYNFVLGQSRADAVAKYLVEKGMSKDKATATSRGSMDAKGTSEASWALDRRVDVLLGD